MALVRETGPGAPCWHCGDAIPAITSRGRRTRSDAVTCSKACRQKRARFVKGVGAPLEASRRTSVDPSRAPAEATAERPMRFAYADPPYPGFADRYYGEHRDFGGEVDHAALLDRLLSEFPDGWALSTSSKTLAYVLQLCDRYGIGAGSASRPFQSLVRVGAWTRPWPPGKAYAPVSAWEPVLFYRGRRLEQQVLDWVHAGLPRDYPEKLPGMKPAAFSGWVFRCLGAMPGDELVDLFPGSGAVAAAWDVYASREAGATRHVAPDVADVSQAAEHDVSCAPGGDPSCAAAAPAVAQRGRASVAGVA